MSNNKDKKVGLVEVLSKKTALPSDALAGGFRLEIRGRNSAIVCGCKKILKYEPQNIALSAKSFTVEIVGERLVCTAYHEGAVCIEGHIVGVQFDADTESEGES